MCKNNHIFITKTDFFVPSKLTNQIPSIYYLAIDCMLVAHTENCRASVKTFNYFWIVQFPYFTTVHKHEKTPKTEQTKDFNMHATQITRIRDRRTHSMCYIFFSFCIGV